MNFGKEMERLRPDLVRFAGKQLALSGLSDNAEDVVQNAIISAWKRRDNFDFESSDSVGFKRWLLRILEHKCDDAIRFEQTRDRNLPRVTLHAEDGADHIADFVDVEQMALNNIEREEKAQALWKIIEEAGLSSCERRVVELRLREDLSHKEIAEVLSLTEVAARQLFCRAVDRIHIHARNSGVSSSPKKI